MKEKRPTAAEAASEGRGCLGGSIGRTATSGCDNGRAGSCADATSAATQQAREMAVSDREFDIRAMSIVAPRCNDDSARLFVCAWLTARLRVADVPAVDRLVLVGHAERRLTGDEDLRDRGDLE